VARIVQKRQHQLAVAEVRELAEGLAEQLVSEFGGRYRWRANTISYRRSGVDAQIDCAEDAVTVDIKLGLMVSPLKGAVESEVVKMLDKYLA